MRVTAIMAEATLTNVFGSQAVLDEQIEQLRTLGQRDGVSIRYMPLASPRTPGLPGSFTLITTQLGGAAYTEHLDGGRILSEVSMVAEFRSAAGFALKASRDIGEWQQ